VKSVDYEIEDKLISCARLNRKQSAIIKCDDVCIRETEEDLKKRGKGGVVTVVVVVSCFRNFFYQLVRIKSIL
jgi:hypothetical protein